MKSKRRILRIPKEYCEVIPIGEQLFSPLFQFENGLRLVIDKHLSVCYSTNWWEKSLKNQLPHIYKYAEDEMKDLIKVPWVSDSSKISLLPIHLVTLGHLEEIVKKYHSECIPELFPTIHFFLGHMDCIKRVRNLYAHMSPGLTINSSRLVNREIKTMSMPINKKLR